MIGTTLGIYEILGELGAGGMGAVYRAEDTTLKRQVAIKVLPDEFARGTEPVWARDGSEIFFRDGTQLLSVGVSLSPEFEVGTETMLFESLMWTGPYGDQSYDVFPDGQSFAMFQRDAAGEPRLRVLTGFSPSQQQ